MNTDEIRIDRLRSIDDEVGQLHPLLKLLLPRLKGVQSFEYTHGNTEMGADVVLCRKEEVFGQIEYVGVIAKLGNVGQDFTAIERQIDECEVERFYNNGKKKIFITEFWVICTGTISRGAKEKIHAKFKTRRIHFVDRDLLIKLIDEHLPNFWTDVPLQIGAYLHSLRTENEVLDRTLSLVPPDVNAFYIDQDVYEAEQLNRKRRARGQKVDLNEQIARHSVILLEGNMGSGKSKLLRRLVNEYTAPQRFLESKLLPVNVTFRDFVDKYDSDARKIVESTIPTDVREELPPDVNYLLLIDGVDEKNLSAEEASKAVIEAANAVGDAKMKAVITSRYYETFDSKSIHAVVKYLELRPLSMDRLLEFIKQLCRQVDSHTRLIEDLKKSSLFKELPRSPIAAILLAQLLNENAKELPSNLTELYSKYTELSLGRWDVDKGLQTMKEFEALSNILPRIAEHFLNNDLQVISVEDARSYFDKYLRERNLGLHPVELFDKLTKRCEIVAVDPRNQTFRFKHKTFAEFFYARAHLKKAMLVDERVWTMYWTTAFYFYVGLQRDCEDLLRAILAIQPRDEAERWNRLVSVPNYLLAGFASPYGVAEDALEMEMRGASDLFSEIVTKRIDSPFALFSRVQLLWLMQAVIRRSYGYEFFKKAIETVVLRLDENAEDPQKIAIALYWLSVVKLEVGDRDCFDFLLENHAKNLPLEVEAMVRYMAEDLKHRSLVLKKFEQRFGRALKQNPTLRSQFQNVWEKPIRLVNAAPDNTKRREVVKR
jgi:hypothetical protein